MGITDLFEEYTIIFKKNGKEVTEANGGDIIDVELKIKDTYTGLDPTRPQEREIWNFNLDMEDKDISDIGFSNATYVSDSLTNAIGTKVADSTTGYFLSPYDNSNPNIRGLTKKIKFKIKLADAKPLGRKEATVTAKGNTIQFVRKPTIEIDGVRINRIGNEEKSFNILIKPMISNWLALGTAAVGTAVAIATSESKTAEEGNNNKEE